MSGNRVWIIATALLVVVIVALGWFLGVSPVLSQAAAADAERSSVAAQNTAQEALVASLSDDFERIGEIRSELDVLRTVIPQSLQVEDFMVRAAGAAIDNELLITFVTVSEPRPYGADSEESGEAPAPAEPSEGEVDEAPTTGSTPTPTAAVTSLNGVYMMLVTIEVEGQPEAITRFADRLQNSDRYFLLSGLTFNGSATAEGEPGGTLEGYLFLAP